MRLGGVPYPSAIPQEESGLKTINMLMEVSCQEERGRKSVSGAGYLKKWMYREINTVAGR
jgi:hypothetical protein